MISIFWLPLVSFILSSFDLIWSFFKMRWFESEPLILSLSIFIPKQKFLSSFFFFLLLSSPSPSSTSTSPFCLFLSFLKDVVCFSSSRFLSHPSHLSLHWKQGQTFSSPSKKQITQDKKRKMGSPVLVEMMSPNSKKKGGNDSRDREKTTWRFAINLDR